MLQLTPLLDKMSKVPLYSQLYAYVKEQIESGGITPGTRLPSIRYLSGDLRISKNTVEAAYQQLVAEGYLESKKRNGLTVLALEEADTIPDPPQPVSRPDVRADCCRYDFRYGDIELKHFPVRTWKRCLSDSFDADPYGVLGYGDAQGNPELRAQIASYLYKTRGVSCTPEQIMIGSGTQYSIHMVIRLLSLEGQRIAMEDPGYNGARTVFQSGGCQIVPVALDQDGLHVDELYAKAAGVSAVYVTPSHQFPLGMILSVQKRMRLLQWAAQHDAIIIEDDYDGEFRYVGQPIPSLKALDMSERVVYLGTFSKSFLPAARLSYAVLPKTLLSRLEPLLSVYNQPASPIIQQAVSLFMSRGHFSGHVRKMRRLYQAKHKALIALIQQEMGERVTIIGHKSGLHILLDVIGKDSEVLLEQAARKGVRVYSPRIHWLEPDECPRSYVLLGFGGLSDAELAGSIRLLREAWFG
ncbi:PLP-dependent aminotransferase family protein [Paenibacillus ginsengarvi]|nr:PLP-dependent aminotransferase family protein [Paenibacillus ginsengarvi]